MRVAALSKEEDSDLKRLAEMKAYLEKKIAESEREVERLRSFLEIVDSQLAEKSFKRVKITAEPEVASKQEKVESTEAGTGETWPISTPEGIHLADLKVTESEITLVPDAGTKYDAASPPMRAFLVARVLDPMHAKDQEAARNGELSANDVLTYELDEDRGTLKTLRIHNYGDQRRLNEIRNAIRWTVRRMYEKTLQSQ